MASSGTDLTAEEVSAFQVSYDREIGSLYEYGDTFWTSFVNDREVFEAQTWEAADLRAMFKKDGSARAVQQAITGPITSASWVFKPGDGDNGEADFITEALSLPASQGGMATSMTSIIAQMLTARIYRRAFFEKVYTKRADGKITYAKIAYRPPGTCSIRRDRDSGEYLGFKQWPVRQGGHLMASDMSGVDIDAKYAVVHINGQDVDPVNGYSDMEIVYWCHVQKFKLLYLWFLFCETTAQPRTVLTGGAGGNLEADAQKLSRMKGGGVVAVDGDAKVQIVEAAQGASSTFEAAINWLNRTMSESVLAGFLNLTGAASSGSRGSQALSKDQSSFFLESLNRVANELQDTVTTQIVAPLVHLNFGPDAIVPEFQFGTIGDGDIDRIVTLMSGLAASTSQPYPAAFLFQLAEKAAVYLDMDVSEIKDDMDKAQKMADQSADIALEQKQVALKTAKNPPAPVAKPGVPPGAPGFQASLGTISAALKKKGQPSGKPTAPAKPAAAAGPTAKK